MNSLKEKIFSNPFRADLMKILVLAFLYYLTGRIGLMLAVPPGYATIIWPPSGIAVGMLLVYGWRIWPGILIGSFILNCQISGVFSQASGLDEIKTATSFFIAAGSTLQALGGRYLAARVFGVPVHLKNIGSFLQLLVMTGPLACAIAASTGVASLHYSGLMPQEKILQNWVTWWAGDVFGVIVFMPLVLLAPGRKTNFVFNDKSLIALPMLAMLAIVSCLGLTFYGWKAASEIIYKQSLSDFQTLSVENEKALLHRMDSYAGALLGGAGFFTGSSYVSREEWRVYVEALDIKRSFPGINGIGYIADVKPSDVNSYQEKIRRDENPSFSVHPEAEGRPHYIITYIEPEKNNKPAVGLNIGFEDNRIEAANLSRDSGTAAITKRIILLQDEGKTPGFLLLYPMYDRSKPVNTIDERREASRGWIYAPFVAKNFLYELTKSQGKTLNISIYDGSKEDPETLIYTSNKTKDKDQAAASFKIIKKLNVMQQEWFVVWESTHEFEKALNSPVPLFILMGGVFFTGIFALFLLILTARSPDALRWVSGDNINILPLVIFLLFAGGSYFLYNSLKSNEDAYLHRIVTEKAAEIEKLVSTHAGDRIMALKRMAQRWVSAGGTPEKQWLDDAVNYTDQLNGLKTVEWVDNTYHVRWVEPLKGNERAVGLNIIFNDERKKALEGAAERDSITLTPPLDLVQGYKGFIAYTPLKMSGRFDGFIVGIFHVNEFFNAFFDGEISDKFNIVVSQNKAEFYQNELENFPDSDRFSYSSMIKIYDQEWTIEISPKKNIIEQSRTWLAPAILMCGIMIAFLLSLTVRYILLSRIKSERLRVSEDTFRTAMRNAPIGKAIVALDGKWLNVNSALSKMLGYEEFELIKTNFQAITHPDDLDADLEKVKQLLQGEIDYYRMDKRYIHKDGHIVWGHLSVSLARNQNGDPNYFISQIEDITERREAERMKSEFISIVSHELRTPLTSIRGSLGLIVGTMSKDVPEKANNLIGIALKNCERLILLINDILDLDKIAAGKMRFEMKEENLENLIQSGIETNAGYAEKYSIKFETKNIPNKVFVSVDSARWQQVFSNLLSNAAKFSPKNAKVSIFVTEEDSYIRVSVKDQGPGIPEEFRSRIFTKFSQADSAMTRQKGGTGLGLNISKEIVEKMNGRIGFESKPGEGSIFWFEFPMVKQNSGQIAQDHNPDLLHILHVEDDKDFSRVLAESLQGKANIFTAPTLKEAKNLLAEQAFSLVLVDVGMPDGSGLSILDDINNDSPSRIPVIIISADEVSEDILRKVEAALVKSRVSEKKIIETILHYLHMPRRRKTDAAT